ncbi:hypothetical protein [Hyphomicrobium sp.]|uniref:hypothetical protein n=1 Tax=Hyphomicrobium sp. TaxID=82 RepID=UPI002D768E26|nr:hypothetical protein [Hyphomicrobium sp.]HET6390129.1 hypothetical protein [Hyphomicrobium sp.]
MGPVLLAAVATMGLGGCESASNILSGGGNAPQASLTLPPTTAPVAAQAKFQIAPIIGSPDNVARDLQSQLASSMGKNGIQVATASNATGEYVVRGYIVAAREKTKAKISYIWDITDQAGKRVHRITGEEVIGGAGKDPWAAVTPPVVQSIADKTTRQIASWWSTQGSANVPVAANQTSNTGAPSTVVASNNTGPAPSPSYPTSSSAPPLAPTTGSITTSGPITAVVPTVTGAPGDGSTTLTSAIQRELTKNGLALSNVPNAQAYKVEGKVAMGQAKDGKQPIQIDWNVIDPAGKKLGTVSQKNEVPQGSLDGAWGKTADAAAAAAAQGIIKLLPGKNVD